MTELQLHGRPVNTVFDLLGDKENDITYSLGWGLANSERLTKALIDHLAADLDDDLGSTVEAIRLQEHIPGTGYTDVEI